MSKFQLLSNYLPAGDQPRAIKALIDGLNKGEKSQVLLGITGSGKTFTMAHVIAESLRPALIMAHNKTLAAQLYSEMKELFPQNAVEYFVSYYDYYQPEAYISRTDTYIEKDASINDQISLLRHSATRSLLERRDVIVVSSVSAIYGLGPAELYLETSLVFEKGRTYQRQEIIKQLVELQYERNDINFIRGTFRVRGENIDIFPSHYADKAWRLTFFGNELDQVGEFDPLTGSNIAKLEKISIYANTHYVTKKQVLVNAIAQIKQDLQERIVTLKNEGKLIEAQRIEQRTQYDIEMLLETGQCKGIENYSRYLSGVSPGNPPPTLFQYLPHDAILFIDESHVTVPQLMAMYNGDKSRKTSLIEHGFRLPSALDNRPLKFEEWNVLRPQTIFVSATPGSFELQQTQGEFIQQIIRPTGLLDPLCIIRPVANQVDDLMNEAKQTIKQGYRVLVTVLTKKMAEDLTEYLKEVGYKAEYLHSNIYTLDRVEIISKLREGKIDILVGINLLREGLDIPECATVAILDADKEGFLRSESSLIQTIGRAARNVNGKVVLYADHITGSIARAVEETHKRRQLQIEYNTKYNIEPKSVNNKIKAVLQLEKIEANIDSHKKLEVLFRNPYRLNVYIEKLKKEMIAAAGDLNFEKAAKLRDQIKNIEDASINLI